MKYIEMKSHIEKMLKDLMTSTEDVSILLPNYCCRVFEMYSALHHIAVKLEGKKRAKWFFCFASTVTL